MYRETIAVQRTEVESRTVLSRSMFDTCVCIAAASSAIRDWEAIIQLGSLATGWRQTRKPLQKMPALDKKLKIHRDWLRFNASMMR